MSRPHSIFTSIRATGSNILKTDKPHFKQIILTLGLGLVVFVLLFTEVYQPFSVKVGSPSPFTVKAPRTIKYIDNEATDELREKARNGIDPVYRLNPSIEQKSLEQISNFFIVLQNLDKDTSDKFAFVRAKTDLAISDSIIQRGLATSVKKLEQLQPTTLKITQQLYANRIRPSELNSIRKYVPTVVSDLSGPSAHEKAFIGDIITGILQTNYTLDDESTNELKDQAAAKVLPVIKTKVSGEIIVRDGEIITKQQSKLIKDLNLIKEQVGYLRALGLLLFSAVLVTILTFYLAIFHNDIFSSARLTVLLYSIIGLTLVVAKLLAPEISIYLIPIQATAMLATIVFSHQVALIAIVFSTLFISMLTGNLEYSFFGLFSGAFMIFFSRSIRERSEMVKAGIYASVISALIAFALSISLEKSLVTAGSSFLWASGGAAFSVVIAIGLLAFIEPAFQITTDLRLLDLANPNQPLLRELMMKAPGTYNHSIFVGNLADAAAQQLGANQLLVRVGAYYHDIGKMKRPLFFIENNLGQKNQHDNINPNLSSMVIRAHVDEGLEMAKKHSLPKEIQDIIEQHHGNTLVSYFYEIAKKNTSKEETIHEESYRYPGKKPQSREAAIVMLADAVEAAARTIPKPSINRFKQLAKKVIDGKLKDGQLNESDLTLGDLQKMVECFANMLHSFYHQRVEYPEQTLAKNEPYKNARVIPLKQLTDNN